MKLEVFELQRSQRAEWEARIQAMEKGIVYPLGDDEFEIDHGPDYFAFFERMGRLRYFLARRGKEVAGAAAFVLRQVPDRSGQLRPIWYACDFKVAPRFRGSEVVLALIRSLRARFGDDAPGYAVSMNPPPPGRNRVVSLLQRAGPPGFELAEQLLLYSLEAAPMRHWHRRLSKELGPITYLSHAGRKDIVLKSSGRPLPLRHLQYGPMAAPGAAEPEDGAVHMFCLPQAHPLVGVLAGEGVPVNATASVLSNGMPGFDFGFVLTSDI